MTIKDGEQDFTISTTGSMSGVRDALCQIRSRLAKLGVNKDTRGTVEIVLAEAMNNIVEHAYDIDNTGPLDVSARAGPNFLYFILQDQGNSLPNQQMPPGNLPDNTGSFDSLPEGGFGWFLIRDLTNSLQYHRKKGKNQLILSIPRNGP